MGAPETNRKGKKMTRFLKVLGSCWLAVCLSSGCIYVEEHYGDEGETPWADGDGPGWCEEAAHGLSCDPGEDEGCGTGCAVCVEGVCTEFEPGGGACSADSDCFEGEACLGGECLWCPDACEDNGDCDSGWRCSDADVCIPADRCLEDDDCRDGRVCAPNGRCSEPIGEPPADDPTDDPGDEPTDDPGDDPEDGGHDPEDCPSGDCADHCTTDSECGPDRSCVSGACQGHCATDAECGTGQVCGPNGMCVTDPDGGDQCLYNADCTDGVCENGYCHDRCTADSECAAGDFCDAGSCRPDTRPVEPECRVNADCGDGEVCSDAQCKLSCTCDEDCGAEGVLVCDAGACVAAPL